jgi:hypothetical protein
MQKIWKGEQIQEERQEKERTFFSFGDSGISMTPRNQKKKKKIAARAPN